MTFTRAQSAKATKAATLTSGLQEYFASKLCDVSGESFERHHWLRDEGRHGGGDRYALADSEHFNRAAINVSAVHYDDEPDKKLASADALSTIIHPHHPLAPSVHMHFSWTEMRDGSGYFRMMADLNPAIANAEHKARFAKALRDAAPALYDEAAAQGDRYFYIPALDRHRGVTHFYLEGYNSGDFEADRALAEKVAKAAMDTYVAILGEVLSGAAEPTPEQYAAQLHYHTVYLFQVLTLDRGTTSGLLVHDQNDLGIMGSLPSFVDAELLETFGEKMAAPQSELLEALVACLPGEPPCEVDDEERLALAAAVRKHYRQHPEALAMQARGNVIPPTVDNHS